MDSIFHLSTVPSALKTPFRTESTFFVIMANMYPTYYTSILETLENIIQ